MAIKRFSGSTVCMTANEYSRLKGGASVSGTRKKGKKKGLVARRRKRR